MLEEACDVPWNIGGPIVLDSNCVTYLLDALMGSSRPADSDPLATQKVALVRILFYAPRSLAYTEALRKEIEAIPNVSRRANHLNALDVLFSELFIHDRSALESECSQLVARGINAEDARWICEAVASDAALMVTWDRALLAQAARVGEVRVQSPTNAYTTLGIGTGTQLRTQPAPNNPLSRESWWRI